MRQHFKILQKSFSLLAVFSVLASCGSKTDPELKVTVPLSEVYPLPIAGWSCTDRNTGADSPGVDKPILQFDQIKIEWKNKKNNLNLSYIRIYTEDKDVDGDACIIDGNELVYLIGNDPDTDGIEVIVGAGATLTLPASGSNCKITCKAMQLKKGVQAKAIPLKVEVYGADTSNEPKPVKGFATAVLLPAQQ